MTNVTPIPESIMLLALLKDSAILVKETAQKIKRYEESIKEIMEKLSPEQRKWVEDEWKPWSEKNLK